MQVANPAGAVNGQDERATPAVDSPARFCRWVIKGRQQRVLPPLTYIQVRGASVTDFEQYKEHIEYTFNAYCKVVILHAAIDEIRRLRSTWKREISFEYLTEEKFYSFSTEDRYFAARRPAATGQFRPVFRGGTSCFFQGKTRKTQKSGVQPLFRHSESTSLGALSLFMTQAVSQHSCPFPAPIWCRRSP